MPGWERITDGDGRAQYLPAPVQQPRQAPVLAEVLPPADAMPMARQTVIHDRSTEVERSTAFVRSTIPLSFAMAAAALVATIIGGAGALLAVTVAFLTLAGSGRVCGLITSHAPPLAPRATTVTRHGSCCGA